MNKNDLKLVGVLLIIISIFFIIINITKKEGKTAVVYYEDKEILKIDLNTNKEYTVKLYPEQDAEARFPYIPGATLYAYCNKHGLWKAEVK